MTWIQTYDGVAFSFQNPDPDSINIKTIATCLSRIQRFGGHLSRPYTVAEHSMVVASLCCPEYQLEGLLHDATEAYIGDIVRPLKLMIPQIAEIEERVRQAIWVHFGLQDGKEVWDEIKRWDNACLGNEAWQLFDDEPLYKWHEQHEYLHFHIEPLCDSAKIADRFMRYYKRLVKSRTSK